MLKKKAVLGCVLLSAFLAGCEGSQYTKDQVAKEQAAKAKARAAMGSMGGCLNYIDELNRGLSDDLSCVCVGSDCDMRHSGAWDGFVTVTKLRCTAEGCLVR